MNSEITSNFMSKKDINLILYAISLYSNPTTDYHVKLSLKKDLLSSMNNSKTFYFKLAKHYLYNFSRESYMMDLNFLNNPESDDLREIREIINSLEYNVSSGQKSFVADLHQYWLSKVFVDLEKVD